MKKVFVILSVILPAALFGQINFEHTSLEKALAKAKAENKPLFVDVYAEWCGPCKRMAATTFQDKGVSDYFNKEFISLKIDGEKADGPRVMNDYQITAYPTLLFFYPDGTLANKFIGGIDVEPLKRLGMRTAHPEQDKLYQATKKYHASKKSKDDMQQFISVLTSEQGDSLTFYCNKYYESYPDLKLDNKAEFQVFLVSENNYLAPISQEFLKNIKNYDQSIGFEKIKLFINASFDEALKKGDFSICETASRALFLKLNEIEVPDLPTIEDFLTYMKSEFYGE